MACKKRRRKNYGGAVTSLLQAVGPMGIIAIAVAVLILFGGTAIIIKFISIMGAATKGIPVWALLVIGIIVVLILKNKRR